MMSVEIPYIEILVEIVSGREDRRAKGDAAPVLTVTAMVVLSVVMSAVFASYTVGLFYGAYQRRGVDIAVMGSSKIEEPGGRAIWSVTLALRNIEEHPIEISRVDLSAGGAPVGSQISMSPGAGSLLRLYPGEVRLVDIVISNYNVTQSPNGSLVFVDTRLSSGMWISLRLVDHTGSIYHISFPLP